MSLVLIADDNADITDVLRHVLTRAGFSVLTAADGLEALTRALSAIPDLLLTDLNMPGMDGWRLCTAIRAEPATADMPIAVLSGSRRCDTRIIAAPVCRAWVKPLANSALVAGVRQLITAGRHAHFYTSPCVE